MNTNNGIYNHTYLQRVYKNTSWITPHSLMGLDSEKEEIVFSAVQEFL